MRRESQPSSWRLDLGDVEMLEVPGAVGAARLLQDGRSVTWADEAFASVLAASERLANLLTKLQESRTRYCVFGGWLRDTVSAQMHGTPAPRDVDLVSVGVDLDSLIAYLPADIYPTIFGGCQSTAPPVPFDIWPLHESFLIRALELPETFESLLKTADFGINAALYIPAQCNEPSCIIDAGMLSALEYRSIAFNSCVLPFPVLQCARLAAYAAKLDFCFDPPVLAFMRRILGNRVTHAQVVDGLRKHQPQVAEKAINAISSIAEEWA